MSSFPYLHLPSLVQDQVVRNLRLDDLIILSSLSIKSKNTVKSAKIQVESFDWELKKNYRKIRIRSELEQVNFEFESRQTSREWKIDIGSVGFERSNREDRYFGGPPHWTTRYKKDSDIEQVADYFWDLFKIRTCSMVNNRNWPRRWKLWDKNYSTNLKTLTVGEHKPYPAYSPEDVKFILEDVEVSEDVHLSVRVEQPLQYSQGLKHKFVTLKLAHWLHFDAILNSESSFIELIYHIPTSSQLNSLLKKWIDGGLENLTILKIHIFTFQTTQFELAVFEDVRLQREERPLVFKFHGKEHPLEIQSYREIRNRNGKLASVALNFYGFYLYVWHDEQLNAE